MAWQMSLQQNSKDAVKKKGAFDAPYNYAQKTLLRICQIVTFFPCFQRRKGVKFYTAICLYKNFINFNLKKLRGEKRLCG